MNEVYFYAIGGNISFAVGAIIFTHFARKISSIWMNFFKAFVALICFGLVVQFSIGWHQIQNQQLLFFLASGLLGLGIGDIFLFKGFSQLGPGRSIMLFGFQPLILGILSFFLLGQEITLRQIIAILFLILCLLTFSLERYRKNGNWDLKGLTDVMIGISLDAIGVLLTRHAFELNREVTSWEGNFYRCIGAVSILLVLNFVRPYGLWHNFKNQNLKGKAALVIGSSLGTFLSLGLYLKAVQTGHLASISAVSITGSLFSSLFECIYEKKWPSLYLLVAFALFLIGSTFLVVK